MSFGWSAGDFVSAVVLLKKVGKALKDSGGSTNEFQNTLAFLESLDKTLSGLRFFLDDKPQLKWQDELTEQATKLQDAVQEFRRKISKYEPSLGVESERKKVRHIPREIKFGLSERVKELREAIGGPLEVLQNMVLMQSLTSVLSLSMSTSASQQIVEEWTEDILAQIPLVQGKLEDLDNEIKTEIEELKHLQQAFESQIQINLEELKVLNREAQEAQGDVATQYHEDIQSRGEAWTNLQRSILVLQECTTQILQVMLNKDQEMEDTNLVVSNLASLQLVTSAAQIIGSGIASWIGAMVAIAFQKQTVDTNVTNSVPRDHALEPKASPLVTSKALCSETISSKKPFGGGFQQNSVEQVIQKNIADSSSNHTFESESNTNSQTSTGNNRSRASDVTFSKPKYPFELRLPRQVFQTEDCYFQSNSPDDLLVASGIPRGFLALGIKDDHDKRYQMCLAIREFRKENMPSLSTPYKAIRFTDSMEDIYNIDIENTATPLVILMDGPQPNHSLSMTMLALDLRVLIRHDAHIVIIGQPHSNILPYITGLHRNSSIQSMKVSWRSLYDSKFLEPYVDRMRRRALVEKENQKRIISTKQVREKSLRVSSLGYK